MAYAYEGTPQADAIRRLVRQARRSTDPAAHPVWDLAPFVDIPGRGGTYYFEWEREWRHVGDLRFLPEDVAFLVMPEEFHQAAESFFEIAGREGTGPAYRCPYIDAAWPRELVGARLRRA